MCTTSVHADGNTYVMLQPHTCTQYTQYTVYTVYNIQCYTVCMCTAGTTCVHTSMYVESQLIERIFLSSSNF